MRAKYNDNRGVLMKKTLVIAGRLPGLNEYIAAERSNRYAAAKIKKDAQHIVKLFVRSQLIGVQFTKPVCIRYKWVEKDKRRDKDNVSSFGRKIIQDALVESGVLKNDNWGCIEKFIDEFSVDKTEPRIEVEISDEI